MKAALSTQGTAEPSRLYSPKLIQHLERRLQERLKGEVHFEAAALDHYARDASLLHRRPLGIVRPRTEEDLLETLQICESLGVPVTPRGGGTGFSGACCNRAVILDTSRWLNRILEIDPERKTARVEAGVTLNALNREARKHHLLFGPDPVSRDKATFGGMIGSHAGGPHSLMTQFFGNGPRISDQIVSLEVATYTGEKIHAGAVRNLDALLARGGAEADIAGRLHALRNQFHQEIVERLLPLGGRRASGFLLDELLPEHDFHLGRSLCGTQGSCVTLLEATVRLIEDFRARSIVLLGFRSRDEAIDQIPEVLETLPIALEYLSDTSLYALIHRGIRPAALSLLPRGSHWLMVEYGGDSSMEASAQAHDLVRATHNRGSAPPSLIVEELRERASLWDLYETTYRMAAQPIEHEERAFVGWETAAIPVRNLRLFLRDFQSLLDSYHYKATLFGNLGQGILQSRIEYTPKPDGRDEIAQFTRDVTMLAASYRGTYSGGEWLADGGEIAAIQFGERLVEAFAAFKEIWDPRGGMNPGVPSYLAGVQIEHPLRAPNAS